MKASKVFVGVLVLSLLACLTRAASAADPRQASGGCVVGGGYDPNCDVDRSGLIDVVDIQLVAGHWGGEGTWSSDSWGLTGNAGTDPSTNFLGTTDGQDLIINPDGGDVGIGTTSPQARLDVAAGSDQSAIYLRGGPTITRTILSSKWNLEPTGDGDGALRAITTNWDASGGFGFIVGGNVIAPVVWMYSAEGRNAFTVARKWYTGSGQDISDIGDYLDPLFQIRENGRVGIGTTDPQDKLVVGDGVTSANVRIPKGGLCIDSDGSCSSPGDGGLRVGAEGIHGGDSADFDLYLAPTQGNVGIGTTDPGSYLVSVQQRYTGGGRGLRVVNAEGSKSAQMYVGSGGAVLDAEGTTNLHLRTAGMDRLYIDNNGRVGIGTTNPGKKLDVDGTTRTEVLQITGGSDLAEPFDIVGAENVEPGMVVVIDPENPGQLRIADEGYDRMVAGIVSGANGLNAGITMQQDGVVEGSFPVALSGRVYGLADASYGAIQPGDLLTTSDTPGHVRKVTDHEQAQGAIVGKAMSSLDEGQGLILILVTLQ